MKLLDNIICPISAVKVDSNISRLTVFLNAVCIALYLVTGSAYFILLVAVDYAIRAFWKAQYSPLRGIAAGIAKWGRFPQKLIHQAPKLFASRVGFFFAAAGVVLYPLAASASSIVAGVLLVFTFLDSVCNFCVGCLTYHYIVLPFYQHRQNLKTT